MPTRTDECIHEMNRSQCTFCKPRTRVPAQDSAQWGPWLSARLPGHCVSCGDAIRPGQEARSNGRRGWLCGTCGHG